MYKHTDYIPVTERAASSDVSFEQIRGARFLRPSLAVAALYILFLALDMLIHGHSILFYVHIGPRFALHLPHAAPGYDGQFYYQIARNPLHATPFIDHPAYRYERILYPLVVGALSLGQANLIPYMLLLVNFLAIVLGTELVARLLSQYGLSPWFSLAFGLYFGQATAFIFDTAEPLTYGFVCLGLFLFVRKHPTLAALSMGLAVLTRETAVLFPLGFLLFALYQKDWRNALRLLLLSFAPTAIWYGIVWVIFRGTGLTTAPAFELVPFAGLFYFAHDSRRFAFLIPLMFIPTVISLGLLIREALAHRWWNVSWAIWLFNLILVTNMSPLSYVEAVSAGRLSTGLVLAMLFYGLSTKNREILWVSQLYVFTFVFYALALVLL